MQTPRQRIAALGEFFALTAFADDPSDETSDDTGWRPIGDVLVGPALDDRVRATRAALEQISRAKVEDRVAASTASLGIFARLLSPAIGADLLGIPGPTPDRLQWRVTSTGPVPLRADSWSDGALDALLDAVIVPLVERFVADHALSELIVRGNAASALMGSLRMAVNARPDLQPDADHLADRLLRTPLLRGSEQTRRPFVRRSCCLYYRIPGGGYCGDCVLAHR